MNSKKSQLYEDTINIILIGDQYVGKTSLMKRYLNRFNFLRFTDNTFSPDTLGTVG
jgi:GTP-binding protein EngB required for normal cell division